MVITKYINILIMKTLKYIKNGNIYIIYYNSMSLDQFYTNLECAKKYYDIFTSKVNIDEYDIILEPSAGTGSFYRLFPKDKRIGIDLEPKYDGVEKKNFFDYMPIKNKKYAIVGNPPFGKISSLAVNFFNKSADFADVIAFILPRTFKRVSIQNHLNLNFHLIYSEDIPIKPCCFTPKMNAKCVFQIWKKIDTTRNIICYDKTHKDFIFIKYGPNDEKNQPTPPTTADFALRAYGSNCGHIVDSHLNNLRPKSWHWIKSNIDIDVLKKRFTCLDYSISKDTVRQDSIGQQELIFLYKQKYG
jgi:hypothetical protein